MRSGSTARWLSWLKRLTSNEEIPSSNLGRAFLTQNFVMCYIIFSKIHPVQHVDKNGLILSQYVAGDGTPVDDSELNYR